MPRTVALSGGLLNLATGCKHVSKRRLIAKIWMVGFSFIGLAVTIIIITQKGVLTLAAVRLMLIALLGLYVGVGILVGVYRLVHNMR